jgi:putative oxidoreductase
MHFSIKPALLLIRVTFGLFLLAWGVNKIVNAEGTSGIFAKFYGIDQLGMTSASILGGLQIILSLCIIAGFFRTISYGAGVLIHGVSTISTASHIAMPLAEGSNLLFMAGLPVFGAIVALFMVRQHDTLLSVDAIIRSRTTANPYPV